MASDIEILHMADGQMVDASLYLSGGWRSFERCSLAAGARRRLSDEHTEYALYVVAGVGTATVGSDQVELRRGVALIVVRGNDIAVQAGFEELTLFVLAMNA